MITHKERILYPDFMKEYIFGGETLEVIHN